MTIQILGGSTSQTVRLFIQDTSKTDGSGLTGLVHNTSGLTAYYAKGATGTATAITLATQTAGGAWTSGGFVSVDGTNMPGVYRLDIPNAALDSEVETIVMLRGAANMAPVLLRVMGGKAQANAVTVADKTGYSLSASGLSLVTSWTVAITGNITGNLSGSVGSVTGNVSGSVGSISGVTFPTHFQDLEIAANGHVSAAVVSLANNTITASSIQGGAITAAKFAAGAIDANALAADAVAKSQSGLGTLDNQRYLLAILAGTCSTAATAGETYTITLSGSTYTVTYAGLDATGNRGTAAFAKT